MGIIGAVFLGIFPVVSFIVGIMGKSQAREDLDKMERGRMSMADGARAKTKAGLILGKINFAVAPWALITLIFYIWMMVESNGFYNPERLLPHRLWRRMTTCPSKAPHFNLDR